MKNKDGLLILDGVIWKVRDDNTGDEYPLCGEDCLAIKEYKPSEAFSGAIVKYHLEDDHAVISVAL